jgi:ribosomal protein S18 acetylase RimI-like enzyme
VKIRTTISADLPAIKDVITSCGLFPAEMLDDMARPFLLGEAGREFWLTLEDKIPVGIAYCAPERMTVGTWNLLLIAIHANYQGAGNGAKLMRHIEDQLCVAGERVLLVETSGLPEFERTRNFYTKLNYETEARIRDFYQAGEDKVIFRKSLVNVTF